MLDVKKLTDEEINILLPVLCSTDSDRNEDKQIASEMFDALEAENNARKRTQNSEQPTAVNDSEIEQLDSIYGITYEINRIVKRIADECKMSIPIFRSLNTQYEDAQGRLRITLPEGCSLDVDIEIPLSKNIKNSENISLENAIKLASRADMNMDCKINSCTLGKGRYNSETCILLSTTIETKSEKGEVDEQ